MMKTFLSKQTSRSVVALALTGVLLSSFVARPANAWTIPPCEAGECPGGAASWWSVHGTMILSALGLMEAAMAIQINEIKDRLVRIANGQTQDADSENQAGMTQVNAENTASLQTSLGRSRVEQAMVFAPGASACVANTNNVRMLSSSIGNRNATRAAETQSSNLFSNAAGTPGQQGQLSYLNAKFNDRMNRYCNPATVNLPASVGTCTASIGVDRDIYPFESIFKLDNLASANDYTAAKDVVSNLMGNVVQDPIRGAALSRNEGRTASLIRYSEIAKLNLASAALMSMVERRRDATGAGNSEQNLLARGSLAQNAAEALAQANAAQTTPQNLKTIIALVGKSEHQSMVIRNMLEQIAALKASSLAIDIKLNAARSGSSNTTVIRRQ